MRDAMIDETRAVLRLSGTEAWPFLQGLVTNDLDRLSPGASLYAALLTPQGKYLFDFILVAEGAEILLDVAADRAKALAQRLTMYKLRKDVTLAAAGLSVILVWGDAPEGRDALPDPRHPGLGWRILAADPQARLAALDAAPGTPEAHEALRIRLGVPASGAELIPDESFILETGFERFNGVDFRKGCYVGQEVTARMKHKTELRKGLARVAIAGEAAPGTALMAGEKPAGTLHSVQGGEGLAHLRFDRATGELSAGEAVVTMVERV